MYYKKIQVGKKIFGFRVEECISRDKFIYSLICKNNHKLEIQGTLMFKGEEYCKECKGIKNKKARKLYTIYRGINSRCNNKNIYSYKDYGLRGIRCKWKSFNGFYRDMGASYVEGYSIDRIDNNGNYCKSNCRWTTMKEQARNRRTTIQYQGKCILDWCNEIGINNRTVYGRIKKGWSIEKAIFTRVKTKSIT